MSYRRKATAGRRQDSTRSLFEAVRAAIGAELKKLSADVLYEPIPDRMAELLKQLDHALGSAQNTEDTQSPHKWQNT
jgi:hypothetical protein